MLDDTLPAPYSPPQSADDLPASGPGSLPSVWRRVAARVIDTVVMVLVMTAVTVPVVAGLPADADPADARNFLPRWVQVLVVAVPIAYEVAFLLWRGATPGKMLVGVRVASYATGGRAAPYQLGLRVLVPALGGVLGLLVASEDQQQLLAFVQPFMYVSSVYNPVRRGLHDRAAGTIVLASR